MAKRRTLKGALRCLFLLPLLTGVMFGGELAVLATAEVEKPEITSVTEPSSSVSVLFRIYITNNSKAEVRLPTDGFVVRGGETPVSLSERLVWFFPSGPKAGSLLIPSESELKIVALKSSEVTVIQWKRIISSPEKLQKISAKLIISEDFAKRFRVWSGELIVDDFLVHLGRGIKIQKNQ